MPQIKNIDLSIDHSKADEESAKIQFDVLFWESELESKIPFTCDVYLYDKGKRRRTYYRKLDNPRMVAHVAPFPGHFNETTDFVSKIVHGEEIAPTKEIRKMKFEGKWKVPMEKMGQYQALISLYPKLASAAAWCKEKEM